jgi:hypothetical protein
MPAKASVRCPLGFCNWYYAYDPSDPSAKETAKDKEREHFDDYHADSPHS